jgi:putative cell wall-binding protein
MLEAYRNRQPRPVFALAVSMFLFAACASAPPAPTASLNEAKLAIEAAEKIDANQYASSELDVARQKLILANKAVTAKDMILASRYAEESIVTAELATARSEAAKAEAINDELNRGAKALIEEMQRTGEQQ